MVWLQEDEPDHRYTEVVVIDILSRLPIKDLFRCRRVCWRWNSLITSPKFNNVYVNRGGTVRSILTQERKQNMKTKLFFLEDQHHKSCTRREIPLSSQFDLQLVLSYHGLLLFAEQESTYILNPITREIGTFNLPFGFIKALFYHPVAAEYYAIWIRESPVFVEFKVIKLSLLLTDDSRILKTEAGWEKVCDVAHLRPRDRELAPTWTEDAIYWIVEKYHCDTCPTNVPTSYCNASILVFDIKKENFRVLSHPGGICDGHLIKKLHAHMHLFETNGLVSFFKSAINDFGRNTVVVDIWDLEPTIGV